MTAELAIYKQNRINQLNINYNNNIVRLNSDLVNNIRSIQISRLRNKPALINSLIAKYNNDVSILRRNQNSAISIINSFKPEFNITKTNKKKALLIGVNYIGTPYALSGCIDDANRMKDFLTQHGFIEFKILTDYTSIKPTKQNILNEIKNMIVNANSGDILFFYFSGHGSYTYDRSMDETDGRDEMIVSSDLQGVLDDEIKTILSNHMKREVTIVGLFDSCHSGTMFDLKFNYLDSNNYDKYTENDRVSECNGNVIMISGCMDAQTSAEAFIDNKAQGAMTWSFFQCINKTPNCSWRELLKSMRDLLKTSSFSQIPQLSTDSFYDIDAKIFI
uniref:Peptidase C14 caspase domain-containing protein n=1 Tax=viral metagenome TaxID=1070528 RepID=A0A6C0CW89_9ZZZZ